MDPAQPPSEVVAKAAAPKILKPKSYFDIKFGLSLIALLFIALLLTAGFHKLDVLSGAFQTMQTQTQTLQNNLQQLQNVVAAQTQSQQQQQTALASLQVYHQSPWMFTEADHLVRLANYNLLFAQDITTAITLLQMADERLANLNMPALLSLRQALANDITALRALPKVDIAGLLTKLTALQKQAAQLPVLVPPDFASTHKSINDLGKNPPDSNIWQRAWRNSWVTLQKIIVVRRNDQPIVPLLPKEQQAYLQQNLQLLLQQTQWAVLKGRNDIYQSSLTQAKNWANQYFATNASVTKAFVQTVDELEQVNIAPRIPDLAATITLFNQTASQLQLSDSNNPVRSNPAGVN